MQAFRTVVLPTLLLLAACARTDLGAPCHVQDVAGAELQQLPGRQYLYLGSSECESFACLATAGSSGGYCSQACAGSGASCPSGLTCQQLALNAQYLDSMKARLTPDRYAQLFGQLGTSWYCVRSR
jgi:hypothetical protein